MKRKYKIHINNQEVEREVNIIPGRYIVAMLLTIIETLIIIGVVIVACIYIPYFYIACYLTVVGVIIAIICSNDNPDYKIPWILAVLLIPIAGFMIYFLFYKRKLNKKYVKRIKEVSKQHN
jgi:cardiolipin synthase